MSEFEFTGRLMLQGGVDTEYRRVRGEWEAFTPLVVR
jgi:hypothetical protein